MSFPRDIGREEWNALCGDLRGEDGDFRGEAQLYGHHGSLEFTDVEEGLSSDTTVYVSRGATDLRIGNVQLLVGRSRGVLIASRGPYPIERWTVLWEGGFFPPESGA